LVLKKRWLALAVCLGLLAISCIYVRPPRLSVEERQKVAQRLQATTVPSAKYSSAAILLLLNEPQDHDLVAEQLDRETDPALLASLIIALAHWGQQESAEQVVKHLTDTRPVTCLLIDGKEGTTTVSEIAAKAMHALKRPRPRRNLPRPFPFAVKTDLIVK